MPDTVRKIVLSGEDGNPHITLIAGNTSKCNILLISCLQLLCNHCTSIVSVWLNGTVGVTVVYTILYTYLVYVKITLDEWLYFNPQ